MSGFLTGGQHLYRDSRHPGKLPVLLLSMSMSCRWGWPVPLQLCAPASRAPCYESMSQQTGAMPEQPLLNIQEHVALRKKTCWSQTLLLHSGRIPFLPPLALGPPRQALLSCISCQVHPCSSQGLQFIKGPLSPRKDSVTV